METSITIFGVSLENNTRAQLLHQFEADLDGSVQKTIVTPNPEMLVLARGNKFFREALNKADIRLVDGFGLVLAVWQIFGAKLERYPGVEAVQDIITIAAEKRGPLSG